VPSNGSSADAPAPAPKPDAARSGEGVWKREGFAFIELFALTGLLFAQPVLDWLGRTASDVVLSQHPSGTQILIVVAIIVLVPPLVLWALEAITSLFGSEVRRATHAFLLGALTGTLVYSIVRRSEIHPAVDVIAAGVAGIAMGVLVLRFDTVRTYLRFLAIAPIAFAVLFLTGPLIGPTVVNDAGASPADIEARHPQRVMLVVLDEFPTRSLLDGSGKVDARLFPNFAALAADSTWYRNTTSVAPYTRVAVPAITDGRYPDDPKAFPNAHQYPDTIFTLLGKDFRMNVHEATNETICPTSLCKKSNAGAIGNILDSATSVWQTQTVSDAPEVRCACDDETEDANGPAAAERFLASLHPSHGPQLDYVHLILPHAPWHLLGTGQDYAPAAGIPSGLGPNGTWTSVLSADQQHQRHLMQVQYIDHWLGRVVAKLKAMGEYDSTSLVVTADHGVSFDGMVPYRVPRPKSYSDIVWVPLFVKPAGTHAGAIDERPASTIDVMPTIADLVGAPIPWHVDGRSVLGEPRRSPDPRFLDWPSGNPFEAPDAAKYTTWDGTTGYARVLATPQDNPGAPGSLALSGLGPFQGLVGHAVDPLIDRSHLAPKVFISARSTYNHVDPTAPIFPWADLSAVLDGQQQHTVAVAVNDTIAAVGPTQPGFFGAATIRMVLPPETFEPGVNRVRVFVVEGTPDAPRLVKAPQHG
jgi:hypothetical protein